MTESNKAKLLPFYIVIDVSYSMDGEPLNQANRIIPEIATTLEEDPVLSDRTRFSLVDFADDARTAIPLCDLADLEQVDMLECRGATSYAAAFTHLRTQIETDVNQLKADGYLVHRPAVFFVSDGAPSDDEDVWLRAHAALTTYDAAAGTGFAYYPNIIPFGITQADPAALAKVIHPKDGESKKPMKMYMVKDRSAADAIKSITEILVSSVVASASNLSDGGGFTLPDDDDLPDGVDPFDPGDYL